MTVVDAWQGRVLGSALLARLSDRAPEVRIECFTAEILAENCGLQLVGSLCRVIDQLRPNLSGPAENMAHMSLIAASLESARTHAYVNPRELLA